MHSKPSDRMRARSIRPDVLRVALEDVAQRLGLTVRWEAGHFRGGRCTVNGEEVIILNRHHPVDTHLVVLARCLQECPLDTVYIRPSVREAIKALAAGQERIRGDGR